MICIEVARPQAAAIDHDCARDGAVPPAMGVSPPVRNPPRTRYILLVVGIYRVGLGELQFVLTEQGLVCSNPAKGVLSCEPPIPVDGEVSEPEPRHDFEAVIFGAIPVNRR